MYDVITIGTVTRDVFSLSRHFKVLQDPEHLNKIGFPTGEAQCFALGAKIDLDDVVFGVGGGAANSAVTFARQGLKTGALAVFGDDTQGRDITSSFKKEKITLLRSGEKNLATTYSTILLSPLGERTVLVYRNPKENITADKIPFPKLKTKWLYIVPGAMNDETLRRLVNEVRKRKIKIAINPSKHFLNFPTDRIATLLKSVDLVTLNREEAAALTKADYDNESAIFKQFDNLIKGMVVMTDGPRGVMVSDGKKVYRAGIYKEEKIVDRTGAGDAFGSGFTTALIREQSIETAIRLGSANATAVVEKIGAHTGVITKKDFDSSERWQKLDIKISNL
jgi:ribokinase